MSEEKPWEAYGGGGATAPAEEKPWEAYAAPAAPSPRGPLARLITGEKEPVGYGEDIAKGTAGGFGRGVAGLVGLPGTVGGLVRSGLTYTGVPEGAIDYGSRMIRKTPLASLTGPDAGQVQGAIEGVTGKFYEPQTIPGQYASTGAEFLPGALIPGGPAGSLLRKIFGKAVNTVVPAVTSETAGQLTKDTPYEPWARGVGGIVGGFAGAKAITPIGPADDAYARAVAALEDAGVPLTAGRRTGSKKLQWTESAAVDMPLIGGQAARLQDRMASGLDRAATNRVYDRAELTARGVPEDVHLPDPRVAVHGPESLKDNYGRLTQAPFVTNPQFQNRMTRAQAEYERLVQPHNRSPNIEATQNDIIDRLVAGKGRMAGDEYQSIREQIGTAQRAPGINPQERIALTEYKRALDEAYLAGLSPKDAAALMENNRRYALMKQTQRAVDNAGEHLSPMALNNAVKAKRPAGQYAARGGDLDELANAASVVMKPLPNSGTAARLAAQSGGTGTIGAGVGAIVGGPIGAAIGAGIGAVGPLIAPGLATSRLGQAYLGNRALPQSARDIIAQTLMQQAISQPSGYARNQANREAYRKKSKEQR
jgi:hypothetical protein